MTYRRHFEPGRRCEAPGCRVETRLLWRVETGLTRACTRAHADDAQRAWDRRHNRKENHR